MFDTKIKINKPSKIKKVCAIICNDHVYYMKDNKIKVFFIKNSNYC